MASRQNKVYDFSSSIIAAEMLFRTTHIRDKTICWTGFMAWKNLKQSNLADSMLIDHDALKELDVVVQDSVTELIDWSRLEQVLQGIHASPRGEKAWPPLLMLKALLLRGWYWLSDPALEKQLAHDLLIRRFVALDSAEMVNAKVRIGLRLTSMLMKTD